MFPSQGELGSRWGWSSPWRTWPQRCYPLKAVTGMGLAQKHRAGDGHGSGSGNHSASGRGYSGWEWSAGEITLAWDRCRTSVLTEVRGHSGHGQLVWAQSVSLVVILVKVRWSGGHLDDDGAILAQVYLSGSQLTCIRQSQGYSGQGQMVWGSL